MKQFFTLLFALAFSVSAFSQNPNDGSRSELDPAKYPFYHGVASGDPLADRVILWTRITLDPVQSPVSVTWEIATDTLFTTPVNSGTASTDSAQDYTIKVDATGLSANTWYYYRFNYDTLHSVIGRTKTLPTGSVNNLRFAVASCQDYQRGYYNAHNSIAKRNDLDAVLFLGDFTYEKGISDTIVLGRVHEPANRTVTTLDYRQRSSQYHLDPDLQESQRQYPWISVWDDHETANNSYTDGAKAHYPEDGSWYDRKVAAILTYQQWMPIRMPDPNDTFRIFRRFTFGDLVDLNMIDTRLYDRSKPVDGLVPVSNAEVNDSTRTMVGPAQMTWLENNLDSSTAQWQVLGQQVIMAPLVTSGNNATIVNPDQWDGYPFERQRLYDHITSHNIENVVVLTGDIHTSWANDLPLPGYDTSNRENSVGVEFVATSITSNNELPPFASESLIYGLAPYVRYVNLYMHGYYVLDVRPNRVQADFKFVSTITEKPYQDTLGPAWYVNDGEHHLNPANAHSVAQNTYPALAPNNYLTTGIAKLQDNITTLSAYPNPFMSQVIIQYNTWKPEPVTLQVYNADGKLMLANDLGVSTQGLNHAQFDGSNLPSGFYRVVLRGKSSAKGEAMIKVN